MTEGGTGYRYALVAYGMESDRDRAAEEVARYMPDNYHVWRAVDAGILIRTTGDIIALSPPLIMNKSHIDELIGKLAVVLKNLD